MYLEQLTEDEDDVGPAWIGRVRFSKTGRTLFYRGRTLEQAVVGPGTHRDKGTGERFFVCGIKWDLKQLHWADREVEIDDDAAVEYERRLTR
ncbi:MAG: hypothetical protein JWN67_4444 [Actinomycetia bacterium]|jgi:hypothetical protein|nr:hypothetical protein [Actinomycetes bacterium]